MLSFFLYSKNQVIEQKKKWETRLETKTVSYHNSFNFSTARRKASYKETQEILLAMFDSNCITKVSIFFKSNSLDNISSIFLLVICKAS